MKWHIINNLIIKPIMRSFVLFNLIIFFVATAVAQNNSDANIFGHVKSGGEHLPFISIVVKGTTIGTSTDATGHYWLVNLPEGKHTIRAQGVGYKPMEVEVIIEKGISKEVDFDLEEDILMLEQVVVSANRFNIDRSQTPVIINVISPKLFDAVQAVSLSEGLSFTPGLRVETNCQNCGYTQLRMNGLDGAYSQILINSRPIFGSLAGVYGLEQIPANMVDRVEVIRGGGSALFGGSAIAGTVNIITKDPINNTFHVGSSLSIIDGNTPDASVNFNASIITDDRKSGIFIFGVNRNRTPWDANGDGFSEITKLKGNTLGFKVFHRPTSFSRVTVDFNSIGEFRRGGNGFDLLPHQADLSEQLEHRILTGGATYETYLNDYKQKLSVYASAQTIARDSYYGAAQDPNAYGQTQQNTFIGGLQYAHDFSKFLFSESTLTAGAEFTTDELIDEKLSSQNTNRLLVNDQNVYNAGFYAQNQWNIGRLKFLLGLRADKHSLLNSLVINPRTNFLFNLTDKSQLRLSYARGFRAPQIFDEDLHIELAGAQALRRENSANLKAEVSNSISGSLDYTGDLGKIQSYLLLEGFYTFLSNAFITNIEIDNNGLAYLLKSNGSGAKVYGGNAELQLAPSQMVQLQFGFTLQQAKYVNNEILWEPASGAPDSITTTGNILRTPNSYGYFVTTISPVKNLSFSLNGTYTGSMFTSHMVDPATSFTVVKQTPKFFDTGLKASYSFRVTREVSLQLSGGVQNLLNSFQDDLDSGMFRDATYFYGPSRPRTIVFSLKVGSL
jgi:outer membrane receptor for ferrienterochelin and colicins